VPCATRATREGHEQGLLDRRENGAEDPPPVFDERDRPIGPSLDIGAGSVDRIDDPDASSRESRASSESQP